jgi:ABC-type multidrug transport system ATPase subunit
MAPGRGAGIMTATPRRDGRQTSVEQAGSASILRVAGLRKRYGRAQILQDVTFDVSAGSVVALLGANGAGKTTTLKCILGVIPFDGAVEVAGIPVQRRGKDARRRIGYVPQSPALSEGDTCDQALTFFAEIKGAPKSRVPELLELVNLAPQHATKIGHLSGGMRQRLALAAALLADPPLLLLDEPAASLDIESRRDLQQLVARLRDEGKTVILSTHFLDHLDEVADRALILHEGRLTFDGSLDELARRVRSNRYVVNLNGNAPATFLQALSSAGIGPERVHKAELGWEEILLASTPDAAADALPAQEERP